MTEKGCGEAPGAPCFGVGVPTRGPAAAGVWGLGAPKFAVTPQLAALTPRWLERKGDPPSGGVWGILRVSVVKGAGGRAGGSCSGYALRVHT